MGLDPQRFVNLVYGSVMTCPLCHLIFEDPVQCSDEHLFCKACIENALSMEMVCPTDQKPVADNGAFKPAPKVILTILNDLSVKCEFTAFGCDSVVKLADLDAHQKSCPFAIVRNVEVQTEMEGSRLAELARQKLDLEKEVSTMKRKADDYDNLAKRVKLLETEKKVSTVTPKVEKEGRGTDPVAELDVKPDAKQVDKFAKEIKDLTKANQEYRDRIKELTTTVDRVRRGRFDERNEKIKEIKKNHDLEALLVEKETAIKDNEAIRRTDLETIDRLRKERNELKVERDERKELHNKLSEKSLSIFRLESDVRDRDERIVQLEKQLTETDDRCSTFKQQILSVYESYDKIAKLVTAKEIKDLGIKLKFNLASGSSPNGTVAKSNQSEMDEMKGKINMLTLHVKKQNEKYETLEKTIVEKELAIKDLEIKSTKLEIVESEKNDEIKKLNDQIKDLSAKNNELCSKVKDLEGKLEKVRDDKAKLESQLIRSEALEKELDLQIGKVKSLESQLATATDDLRLIKSDLDQMRDKVKVLEKSISAKDSVITILKQEITSRDESKQLSSEQCSSKSLIATQIVLGELFAKDMITFEVKELMSRVNLTRFYNYNDISVYRTEASRVGLALASSLLYIKELSHGKVLLLVECPMLAICLAEFVEQQSSNCLIVTSERVYYQLINKLDFKAHLNSDRIKFDNSPSNIDFQERGTNQFGPFDLVLSAKDRLSKDVISSLVNPGTKAVNVNTGKVCFTRFKPTPKTKVMNGRRL